MTPPRVHAHPDRLTIPSPLHRNDSSSSVNNSRSGHTSDTSSPPINTPEFRPTASPYHGKAAVSPMLDALSVPDSSIPGMTNDWARAGLSGSPSNLISLMGESPPTQPSSFEEAGRLPHPWQASRPFMTPANASPSPPNSVRRPLSYQMDARFQSPEIAAHQEPDLAFRRSSLQSQFTQARQPPLPHQAQAHFYSAPNLGISSTPQSGMKAGERGHFFGFDKLPTRTPGGCPSTENVAIAGYEGGLEVYSVNKRGVEPHARLQGLCGGVRHAKILPWLITGEMATPSPLIVVVLHGPVLRSNAPEISVRDATGSPQLGGTASPRSAIGQNDGLGRSPVVEHYQTSVQVYSLKTNKLVDTLLECPKIPISTAVAMTSTLFQPPPPTGALSIKADGKTLAVCSGVTGECWVFSQLLQPQNDHSFVCVGKLWTTLQQSEQVEVPEEGDRSRPQPVTSSPTPIFAINGRWVAYCPAPPSSQLSLRAHIPLPILGKGPGISTLTPPSLPSSSLAVDLPISDSMVNKIMRETTQELIQGAKWVGQQGLQAWNSYWNKSQNAQSPPQQARSPPQSWPTSRPQTDFPPTHGSTGQAAVREPGLVSIINVEALGTSSSIHPLATFNPPLGCSFLSFSPSSLSLFTVSTKGDVQTVWDLFRIQTTKSSPLQATVTPNENSGPLVRQIAQFSRMTVARVVDVAWTGSQGERIAMVTERGTVHLLDMPFSAFMWPPPRRRKISQDAAAEGSEPSSSAVSIASGAFGAAYQVAKPFVSRSRRGSGATPGTTVQPTLKDSAVHGGRVIAASISSSLGKTGTAINQLRNTGENRVPLPPSTRSPEPSCVVWIRSRKAHVLFALGGGLVRSFPCKARQATMQNGKRIARPNKYNDFKVPLLPDDVVPPAARQIAESGVQEEVLDLTDHEMEAGNTITLDSRSKPTIYGTGLDAAIPQAEIESSAPYQPFHTDRRVSLGEYLDSSASKTEALAGLMLDTQLEDKLSSKKKKKMQSQEPGISHGEPCAWAFGQPLASVKRSLGGSMSLEADFGDADDRALPPSAMERVLQVAGDQEQIVVTTRRRRGARQGGPDEDGFFEDDCEVLDFADQRV